MPTQRGGKSSAARKKVKKEIRRCPFAMGKRNRATARARGLEVVIPRLFCADLRFRAVDAGCWQGVHRLQMVLVGFFGAQRGVAPPKIPHQDAPEGLG